MLPPHFKGSGTMYSEHVAIAVSLFNPYLASIPQITMFHGDEQS